MRFRTYTVDECWDIDIGDVLKKINDNCGIIEKIVKKDYRNTGENRLFFIWYFMEDDFS